MKSKLYIIIVTLVLVAPFTSCTKEEIVPDKQVDNIESPEYDGIPESDAHTDPGTK